MKRLRGDRGSTIPLILGIFVVTMTLVAGSVAASDAFVRQSALQDVCDGAAIAAANSVNLDDGRHVDGGDGGFLGLYDVQTAVDDYRTRDPGRRDVTMLAAIATDEQTVTVQCFRTSAIAFGAWFGFASGIRQRATSSARAPTRAH